MLSWTTEALCERLWLLYPTMLKATTLHMYYVPAGGGYDQVHCCAGVQPGEIGG